MKIVKTNLENTHRDVEDDIVLLSAFLCSTRKRVDVVKAARGGLTFADEMKTKNCKKCDSLLLKQISHFIASGSTPTRSALSLVAIFIDFIMGMNKTPVI